MKPKSIAIMQPYFLPYLGYYQLINLVDEFVIYDNIEFTKKGWINRNRILINGKADYISLPLKKDSDFLFVNQRFLVENAEIEKNKLIRRIENAYRKSPYFSETFELLSELIATPYLNLFDYILHVNNGIIKHLNVNTAITISSNLNIQHELKAEDKVVEICKNRNAAKYVNPIGGQTLYSFEFFQKHGLQLNFLKSNPINYQQFENEFVPYLSIIDTLMFNSREQVIKYLNQEYTIIEN